MTATSADAVNNLVMSLKVQGVRSVALTTIEGRSLGSTVIETGPRFKLGALSAAAIAISTKTAGELALGELDQVQIVGVSGSLLLSAVGNKALLSVVTERGTDSGPIVRDMKRIAVQLASMI